LVIDRKGLNKIRQGQARWQFVTKLQKLRQEMGVRAKRGDGSGRRNCRPDFNARKRTLDDTVRVYLSDDERTQGWTPETFTSWLQGYFITAFEFYQELLRRARNEEGVIRLKLQALKREDPRGMRTRIEREQLERALREPEAAGLKIEDRMIAEDVRV
jgi:hypothetical protein